MALFIAAVILLLLIWVFAELSDFIPAKPEHSHTAGHAARGH